MKNIAVLSVLVITVILFSAYPAYTQTSEPAFCINHARWGTVAEEETERSYIFSFGASFGFVCGRSFEIVYPYDTPYKYLSELRWDMKPVFYLGLQADFSQMNPMDNLGFFASLSFNIGIPYDSGIMEDRDWMNKDNELLTHYSRHTNKTKQFFWLDAAAGISIPVKNFFYIKPFLGGSWMRFSFSGRNGYGEYNYPGRAPFVSYEGREVIRYEQNWFIVAAGLSIGTESASPFSFELSFQISPLIFCAATDVHLPSTIYKDYMSFGLFMEPKAKAAFSVKNIELSLEFSYRHIGKTKGFTYMSEGYGYNFAGNYSGAGLSIFNTRFIVKFSI